MKLDGLGHPPTTSFWSLPLALVNMQTMSVVLADLVVLLLLAEMMVIGFELRLPSPPWTAAFWLGLILLTPFMQYHLSLAQVSELIGFLYFLSWLFLRRGRDAAAGAVLGLACTFKLFPGVMVLLLLFTRRWRAVLAACVAYLVVAAVMTSRFGIDSWMEYYRSEGIIANYWIGHMSNASIQGIVLRLLHRSCHGAVQSDFRATSIAATVSLTLLLLVWRLSRHAAQRASTIDLPFALFALLSQFTNPFFFEHYNVLLVLPIALAGVALYRAWRSGLSGVLSLVGVAALSVVLGCLTYPPNNARGVLGMLGARPQLHFWVHFYEIVNWLPVPILMALIGSLLLWFERRGFRGLVPFAVQLDEDDAPMAHVPV